MYSQIALYAVAALAGLYGVRKLKIRLELSKAKHPSLAGHAKMARKFAKLIPYYEYDDVQFFCADDAPEPVVSRRRLAFKGMAEAYQKRFAKTLSLSAEVAGMVSDVQFTNAYRVPFQFSRYLREHLPAGNFAASTEGVMITDLDGNRSYDLAGSYGVNVFGHAFYKGCIDRGAAKVQELGPVLGPYHPIIVDNAKRLREISGLDEVSFHMSGTEAVMQAVRLARYHTGRSHLVKFCGAYHGWWEAVQPGIGNPIAVNETYMLKEQDQDTLKVLRTRKDIACVLINPLQALHPNTGAPSDSTLVVGDRAGAYAKAEYIGWLQALRSICTERKIVLIFDEVLVGFRLAMGGAQAYFGIKADMVTYGKTLGGGLPIGVLCGRADLMRRYRDDRPADICFARGTFNSHPYVMGAMSEFLQFLETPKAHDIYANLDSVWDTRAALLNQRLQAVSVPIHIAHLSSVWMVCYTRPSRYHWLFQYYLRMAGLALSWVGTGRLIFSLDYSDKDFAAVTEKFVQAATAMDNDGWWWDSPELTNKSIKRRVLKEILVCKLRLGKWFVMP